MHRSIMGHTITNCGLAVTGIANLVASQYLGRRNTTISVWGDYLIGLGVLKTTTTGLAATGSIIIAEVINDCMSAQCTDSSEDETGPPTTYGTRSPSSKSLTKWPPRVTLGRLLPHARGLRFNPRHGGFPPGAKKEWGLSPKAKVRVLHTAQLDVTDDRFGPLLAHCFGRKGRRFFDGDQLELGLSNGIKGIGHVGLGTDAHGWSGRGFGTVQGTGLTLLVPGLLIFTFDGFGFDLWAEIVFEFGFLINGASM
nr:hypothetical protein [Tanacetum cinerariifolium]